MSPKQGVLILIVFVSYDASTALTPSGRFDERIVELDDGIVRCQDATPRYIQSFNSEDAAEYEQPVVILPDEKKLKPKEGCGKSE